MTDANAAAAKGGKRLELTLRAVVLGCLLAVIFTAANTYLGLLVGLTFASAIPAAVISMAVLRAFRTSTIWENMTVQTVASVGGAMSSIIFVLPGLVMIGWWLEQPRGEAEPRARQHHRPARGSAGYRRETAFRLRSG